MPTSAPRSRPACARCCASRSRCARWRSASQCTCTEERARGFAGHQYKLSLGVADADGGLEPQLEVELSDDAGHDGFDKVFDVPVGGPWGTKIVFTRLHALFRAPVDGPITLSLRNVGTGADPGSISIDRVSLVEVSDDEARAVAQTPAHGHVLP